MKNQNPLKMYRESHLFSKAELAKRADVSPITISRIEQGKTVSYRNTAKDIAGTGIGIF